MTMHSHSRHQFGNWCFNLSLYPWFARACRVVKMSKGVDARPSSESAEREEFLSRRGSVEVVLFRQRRLQTNFERAEREHFHALTRSNTSPRPPNLTVAWFGAAGSRQVFRVRARDDSTNRVPKHIPMLMSWTINASPGMDWQCQSSFCARALPRSGGPAQLRPGGFLDFRYVCRAFLGTREVKLLEEGGDPMRALRTRIDVSRRADGFMEGWVMLDSAASVILF